MMYRVELPFNPSSVRNQAATTEKSGQGYCKRQGGTMEQPSWMQSSEQASAAAGGGAGVGGGGVSTSQRATAADAGDA